MKTIFDELKKLVGFTYSRHPVCSRSSGANVLPF